MDFNDSPEEAAFRAEARSWLAAHARPKTPESAPPAPLTDAFSPEEAEHVRRSKEWQATLYDGGWAGITWPKEYGGRGGTPIQAVIFAEEQSGFDVPGSIFTQGIGMAGPALMTHGSDAQKDRYLAPMLRGDEVWCQLFSEPGAGSDLAGLATRAERGGEKWIVNGQKVWTSSAHYSDFGILLARTGAAASRHRGISYFLVDMRSPGVAVRPLRQMTGSAHFNEVFLTDVAIPPDSLVGPVDGGWAVARTTLTSERSLIGALGADRFPRVLELARMTAGTVDPRVRQDLARSYIGFQVVKYLGWRQMTALSQGRQPGPESSVAKLALSVRLGELGDLIVALQGPAGTLVSADAQVAYLDGLFLGQWSSRFGGGTEQVQRNIIAERILGLPATLPFSIQRVIPTTAPYGTWRSPVTAALLVEQAIRISQVQVATGQVYWNEGRPGEAGRQVIVSAAPGAAPVDALPAGFSARSQVHEYGGRCYAVHEGSLVFSNWQDQRLWLRPAGQDPRPLTPEPPAPRADRYADPVITPDGRWVICVHERHSPAGRVDNDLVAVALDPPAPDGQPRSLTAGRDFYAAPRLSPDGRRLAWMTWDHPNMPWDGTELWVADLDQAGVLGEPRLVAGRDRESITEPRWSPVGVLHYVSDRSGWWNLYDETGASLCPLEAEFAGPDWVFGNSSYGFLPDGRLVAVWAQAGADHLGLIAGGQAQPLDFPFSTYSDVQPTDGAVIAIAAAPTVAPAVVRLDVDGGAAAVVRRSRDVPMDEAAISAPEAVAFPTGGGEVAHALVYPPRNPEFVGPEDERPPLVVMIHGGPTSSTSAVFDLSVQYWTTRGFAVADVDYRGSTGYGTAYRRLLNGSWGVADVEDCAHVVGWLAGQDRVDGRRAVIRGGSAGGFTTLAALAFTDTFAAGASHFGVADLELLARDTHKFESRYLDGLVGPWPEAAEEYRRRSPIHHVEAISCPLILFQGLEDAVVPPAQSELMYEALRQRGIPVAYLSFEGEQHGFRQAATITAVARAELAFYGRVFGFSPDGDDTALTIANAENLTPRA